MNKIVWESEILTFQDADPVIGGSNENTAGHMGMASDKSMTDQISNVRKKPQDWHHPGDQNAGLYRQ